MSQSRNAYLPLSNGQTLMLVLFGAILWFVAAIMLRYLGPMGVYDGMGRVITYALIIPGTVPFLLICYRLAKVSRAHYALAASLMTGTAVLLDGSALAWFPTLYGPTVELHAGAGGTILWGGGVAIWLGVFLGRNDQ